MKTYIFGYGSLLDPQGLNGRGMKHRYTADELHPAVLMNYLRDWNADSPRWGYRYLGVESAPGFRVNGVVFEIAEEDMAAFIKSEGGDECYTYPDVSADVDCPGFVEDSRILTCVTKTPSKKLQIGAYYVSIVDRCLKHRGEEFEEEFWELTPKPDGELK